MPDKVRKNYLGHFLLIAVFAAVAVLPAMFNGVPGGNDQPQHYQFAWTIYDSVKTGEIYPHYSSETNHGFGDFGIRFYPPGTYYALAAAYFLTGDWYYASFLAFFLVFFLGGIGVYLWARTEFESRTSLLAAMLYTFAPYHLNQIYNNGLYAEFFAMAVLPFCFLFLTRICRDGRWIDICGLSLSFGTLILTHIPLTILGSIALALYGIALLKKKGVLNAAAKLLTAVVAAVAITSFYWLRMLPEVDWIKHSAPQYFSSTWDYRSNFLLEPDHFLKFGENTLNLWFADILLVSMTLIAIPSVVYLLCKGTSRSRFTTAIGMVLAFAIFLTTPLSVFVWNNVGFLQKVQFPWRWLAIIALFGSVFSAAGIIKASDAMKLSRKVLLPVGLGLVLVIFFFTAAFVIKGATYVSHQDLIRQMANVGDSDSCDCWLPVGAERSDFDQPAKVGVEGRRVEITEWSPTVKRFHIDSGPAAKATVKTFFYPRWHAAINGVDVQVERSTGGAVFLPIGTDPTDVELTFHEPRYVAIANGVSFSVLALILAFAALLLIKLWRVPDLPVG